MFSFVWPAGNDDEKKEEKTEEGKEITGESEEWEEGRVMARNAPWRREGRQDENGSASVKEATKIASSGQRVNRKK